MSHDSTSPRAIPLVARTLSRRLFDLLRNRTAFLRLAGSRTGITAATAGGTLVVRTLSSVILTRLLTPEDFGIVGIIGAVFFALTMLTDLGFQSFIVRHERGDDKHFLDVIWTIHVTRGVILTIVGAVAAPLFAWAVAKPEVALPLAVSSGTFLLNGAASLSLISALRQDGARKLSLIDFGIQLLQTAACILLALWWRNAWAMIAAMLLQAAMRSVASYVLFPGSVRRPARDREISREFVAFSRIVLASSSLTLLLSQVDKLLLARLFSLDQFGLYAIALNIASAPIVFADSYITRVVFPVYAHTWRCAPGDIAAVYYRVRRIPSLLYAAGCGGLIGGAPLLIALLYDPRYAYAAVYVAILAVASALRLPNFAAAELMTAIGNIKSTLRMNMVRATWLALAIPAGFFFLGSLGIVVAIGTIEVPVMIFSALLLHRIGVLNTREEIVFPLTMLSGALLSFSISSAVLWSYPSL